MPRLFTAIALPDAVTAALAALQPAPATGVRLVAPAQMHVTLHFIGEAEIAHVAGLLQQVAMQPCELTLSGVGEFGKGTVLWAGVRSESGLWQLHAAIGRALTAGGIAVESRPWHPHVTLARCKPHVPRQLVTAFLERHAAFHLPPLTADRFALYSSTSTPHGPLYRVERWFPAD
jgi:2'-5' RNA ligase